MDAPQTARDVLSYYDEVLKSSADLKTSACCVAAPPSPKLRAILSRIPQEVLSRFYGCGSPLPLGIEGLRVLDLGSGSGRDCYVASALVGASGSVTGVDFASTQLEVARRNAPAWAAELGYSYLSFVEGRMEDLAGCGIAPGSVDLCISNCVVNLSADKRAVLAGVYAALRDGGEFFFSDVYCDRRLSASVRADPVLLGECLGGALYIEDFRRLCAQCGFPDPRIVSSAPIQLRDERIAEAVGEAAFTSITFRLFKLPPGRLETLCEDYGQVAVYKGTLEGAPSAYSLDDHHRFEKGKPMLVCGNTASMVQETWLSKHFDVTGDRSVHFGLFPCGPAPAAAGGAAACAPGGACC